MSEEFWESVLFGVSFGLAVLILGTKSWSSSSASGARARAKALIAREEAYRALAERYDALQAESTTTNARPSVSCAP